MTLFRRRRPESWPERLRRWFWPRRSFMRSLRYMKARVLRLRATPHAVAAGIAAGVFASFTPFFGLHFFIALAIAWVLAGNLAAAILGTFFGNPLTFPVIWASTFELGRLMLGSGQSTAAGAPPASLLSMIWHHEFGAIWAPYIKPMLVGSLPLGVAAGLIAYALVFYAVRGVRAAKQVAATAATKEVAP